MSSGAQLDLEWSALDFAANDAGDGTPSHATRGAGHRAGQQGAQTSGGAYLSDEEILGIDAPTTHPVIPTEARNLSDDSAGLEENPQRDSSGKGSPQNDSVPLSGPMPEWMRAAATDPRHAAEARQLWQEHQAFRAAYATPDEARAMKELFPGGAQEVTALREAAHAVDRLDAAIYSGNARAQAEVVSELSRANPAAFRSLFAEAAKYLTAGGLDTVGTRHAVPQQQKQSPPQQVSANGPTSEEAGLPVRQPGYSNPAASQPTELRATGQRSQESLRAGESPAFDATAYAAFERGTNDAVARDVRATVSDTLARVLPEGVAEGAARRIGDDIFQEIHSTLAADPALSQQVGEVLRARQFGAGEQMRVAQLLSGRAKQLVPSVARRVIGEWTTSVLGTARSRSARQAAASSRVDVAAPGGSRDSMPLRALSAREIDYARMSDDEILGM